MNFEKSLKRLDEIIKKLDSNETPLQESIELYKEGASLLGDCRRQLDEAEMLVTVEEAE